MDKENFKKIITEALTDFFTSEPGRQLVGKIVFDALRQALVYEIEMEDATSEPGKIKEKIVRGDILSHIGAWIKNSEGAIRGVQADAAAARNRAGQVRTAAAGLERKINLVGRVLVDLESPIKTVAAAADAILQSKPPAIEP